MGLPVFAHGADAMSSSAGAPPALATEQYWHGLLDHDGCPTRRFCEIKGMGEELRRAGNAIAGFSGSSSGGGLALLRPAFPFQIQANNPGFDYPDHFAQIYTAFYRNNLAVDILSPEDDFAGYNFLVAPALHILPAESGGEARSICRGGRVLMVTQRSGVKDEQNAVVDQRLPGLLKELCGVEVDDYDLLAEGMENSISFEMSDFVDIPEQRVRVLCEILKPTTAQVVARYQQDYYAGSPAITLNHYGKGLVLIGAYGGSDLYEVLVNWLAEKSNLYPVFQTPPGVEATERWKNGNRLLFLLNQPGQAECLTLDYP